MAVGDGARLWAALRVLSDAERRRVERVLTRFRALDGVDDQREPQDDDHDHGDNHDDELPDGRLVVRLPATEDTPAQQWEPLAFAETLVAYLREQAHEQSGATEKTPTNADGNNDEAETSGTSASPASFSLQTEDFPSLGDVPATRSASVERSSSSSTNRPSVKATKRRITTTLVSTDAPYAAVAVKRPSSIGPVSTQGNQENAWSKRNLLEKRMATADSAPVSEPNPLKPSIERRAALLMGEETPPPSPPTTQPMSPPEPAVLSNPWMSPPSTLNKAERQLSNVALPGKPRKAKRLPLTSTRSDSTSATKTAVIESVKDVGVPSKPAEANLQAARIYAHIVVQRIVANICNEIRFLVGLLYRPTCSSEASTSNPKCTCSNEFCRSSSSSAFAAVAIETLEPTLILLGSDMIQLITKSLEDMKLCCELVSRLRAAIEQREERRVQESARIGCELPVETKGTAFRDYALPFCEDMDSRLNYRTPTESVIYSNREKIRDAFLGQLRSFQKKQNSLLGATPIACDATSVAQDTRQILQDVMPENLWWFARFFVLELVQVGSNPLGESDKELVLKIMEDKMVVKNPDRLRKLHRRFSSQKTVDSTMGATTTGFNNGRSKTGNHQPTRHSGNASSKSEKPRAHHSNSTSAVSTGGKSSEITEPSEASRSSDQMRGFFSDNQVFFYHFLVSCDSYLFAELVKRQLEAQFLSIWRATSKADPRKEFTETVLRLKVLGKFIGFLRFSPQWHWGALASALSSRNPALEAAQREAVNTLEQSQSANAFDILGLLEESIVSCTVAKCIPWLCDYMSMLSSDGLSSSTRYIQRALLLMAYVHRSRMLDSLGETGLFVAMQIERLFQVLSANELLQKALRWQRLDDKPPSWMKSATVRALTRDKITTPPAQTDSLPFLYSSMFVQVCIGELDDLRGFIQRRSASQHRSVGATPRRGHQLGARTPGIRKVRPLQVVNEDQLDVSPIAAVAASGSDQLDKAPNHRNEPENDPLRDAFFKLYPQLKRAVEFVVDMVVTNMCEHALSKHVKPSADALIDSCVEDAKANAPSFTQLILHGFQTRLDERVEDFMSTTVTKALQEARDLCEDRTKAALRPLVPPSTPLQLVVTATTLAKSQAIAAVTNLITRSLRSEFLKRVAVRKRAIIKEAGIIVASAQITSGDASSGSDDPVSKDSIARALKFSFDDSADANHTPLEEALHTIKVNVVAMNGLLRTLSCGRSQVVTAGTIASFIRFERGYRRAIGDFVSELAHPDENSRRDMSILFWSWIWRGIRLSMKMFVTILVGVIAIESEQEHDAPFVQDIVGSLSKTLGVVTKLKSTRASGLTEEPSQAVCRFVAQTVATAPATILQLHLRESTGGSLRAVDCVIDVCSSLYASVKALCPDALFWRELENELSDSKITTKASTVS